MTHWPYPFWFAHRGAGKLAPENTLAAFRVGAAHGFQAFECDVKLSADDVPYLLHDDTLERTTSGHGPARDWRWEALSGLDAGQWHSRQFAGEPPPRLEAVLSFCAANGCALNLEIKACPGTERRTGTVVAAWLAGRWPGDRPPPLLSSFEAEALQAAREAAPQWPRAWLLDAVPPDWRARAEALGCVAVVVHHPLLSAPFIAEAHQAGLRVLSYTVNEPEVAARLKAWGIDGLITDGIDRFCATDFTF
jgi:glycerophosphoryl diester phosphodiesterase